MSSRADLIFLLGTVKPIKPIPGDAIWMTPMTCRQPHLTMVSAHSELWRWALVIIFISCWSKVQGLCLLIAFSNIFCLPQLLLLPLLQRYWPSDVVIQSMLMSNSTVITASLPMSDDAVFELTLCSLNSNYLASLDILQIFSFLNCFLSALTFVYSKDLGLAFVYFFHYRYQLLLLQLLF